MKNGIDAESLEGGYIAWLIDNMKQKEAAEKGRRRQFCKGRRAELKEEIPQKYLVQIHKSDQ